MSSTHNMFHRPLLDVPDPFPYFCSTPPPTTLTSLPMTGPAPLRAEDCSLAAWSNTTLSQVMSPRHASMSAVSTRRSTSHRGETASTSTTTTSPQSQPLNPGQSTSPQLFQEREVSSDLFCVSGFRQPAAASGSQGQPAPASVFKRG